MLLFNEKEHKYFWSGKPVPNVTSIISPLSDLSMIPAATLEVARQKGSALHKMVELHAKGDLDEDSLPEWMQTALVQWKKFLAESGFIMIQSEYRVYHPRYEYAGTLDLYGLLRNAPCIIDVKRSFISGPLIGVQLAAYEAAYCEQEKIQKGLKRYALKISDVGPYRLESFTDKNDWGTFLACLTINNWKRRNA